VTGNLFKPFKDAGLETDKPVTTLSTASSFKKWVSLITDKFSSDLSLQQDTFSWRDMLPTHFGEIFEIFMTIVHKKWHHQVLGSIQQVEERLADMDNKIDKILKKRTYHFTLRKIYQSSDPIQQKNLKTVENEIYYCASK